MKLTGSVSIRSGQGNFFQFNSVTMEIDCNVYCDQRNMCKYVTLGMIGRRAMYSLEKFGPSVKTTRDFPVRPPLPPGQIYNPYKQTIMFLG